MGLNIERSLLEEHLKTFFKEHSEEFFLLHTDVGAWGLLRGMATRNELLSAYLESLTKASASRSLLFPLFNYNYAQSRRYDVLNDKCQVGALNEYVRLQKPKTRTLTPIFNFIEWPGETFSLLPSVNPFDDASLWGDFCRRNGRVCFMGAAFSANTFIHHIEEIKKIGYRYLKPMPGTVVFGEKEKRVDFVFRVRPRLDGVVEYDWGRLENDLFNNKLLDCQSLGMGKLLSFNSRKVMEYWFGRLEKDEFYFLTNASRAAIAALRMNQLYPFRFEDFEQGGNA
jgi:aminoglycoside N3'-acetyltransferase